MNTMTTRATAAAAPTSAETASMMEQVDERKIKDRFLTVYILFYALGTIINMPSSFFTTATEYWLYKFRDINEPFNNKNRTTLQTEFTSDFSIVSNVSMVFFIVMSVSFLVKKINILKRLSGSLCIIILAFAFTSIFVQINTDNWQKGFFIMTLVSVFVLTGGCGAFLVTLFELVAKFPPIYLPAVFSGQSICGILAALVQIFAISIGASYTTTGLIYFLIALFFVAFTLVFFVYHYFQSDFFIFYFMKERPTNGNAKPTGADFLRVLKKIKYLIAAMALALGSSVMVHPAITSLVVSVGEGHGNKWNDSYFVPVCTFLFYNLFDYFGRECSIFFRRPRNGIVLLILTVLRIGFIPMLMLCNIESTNKHLPVVFNQDYMYVILIIVFGFTNGYFVNLSIILLPTVTQREEDGPIISILILVIMILALGACSFISAALLKAI